MTNDRADSATFSQLAGELLAGGLSFRFQARGRSMLPTIADGDVLHIESANPDSLRVGDIVLFRQGAEFKAHRIVGKHRELFSTRGDAGVDIDEIGKDQILGRVIAKECRQTGRTISVYGPAARVGFFWREMCRRARLFRITNL
jgi:signal peptidase I